MTTLSELQTDRILVHTAWQKALTNQSYSIEGRALSRQTIESLWDQLQEIDKMIAELSPETVPTAQQGAVISQWDI